MSQPSQVIVLCEDTQTECFIRMFLRRRLGWCNSRNIRFEVLPKGAGSGEQWVRKGFLKELKAYRSRKALAQTCLIIAIDADTLTVPQRLRQFEEACAAGNIPFRGDGERVAFIIPKRNIETWFAYLRGETAINEEASYRRYSSESDCRDDVVKLEEMCARQQLAPVPPPSLEYACQEFNRIYQ
jgi:hypothetical protein